MSASDPSLIKIRAFVVTKICKDPQLRGCIFSPARNKSTVLAAFMNTRISLSPIWDYNPNLFFNIRQTALVKNQNGALPDLESFQIVLRNCVTKLKEHQITALQFLKMNESAKDSNINDLWNHSVNNWIRNSCDPTNLQVLKTDESSRRGLILADDMGFGKTLTTLALVLATRDLAKNFPDKPFK
ncbi:hypothetical protein PTTG_29482 [Puccinia triticina 1-1 BBBD Race 1]|uniref:SNF2_N domain-containing protein n=1 Tax=Puccinia triticina (isolate 1-1 / race 1 (BBBD)) TaxID=630390 RepID=A0A180G3Y3_PUCT1|nr:hypothetical protein PTTG_29482 [Puccinia triticina 1-1 BBBD Race 1]